MHDSHFDYITKSLKENPACCKMRCPALRLLCNLKKKKHNKGYKIWYALLTNNCGSLMVWDYPFGSIPCQCIFSDSGGLCEVGVRLRGYIVQLSIKSPWIWALVWALNPCFIPISVTTIILFHETGYQPVHKVCRIFILTRLDLLK